MIFPTCKLRSFPKGRRNAANLMVKVSFFEAKVSSKPVKGVGEFGVADEPIPSLDGDKDEIILCYG